MGEPITATFDVGVDGRSLSLVMHSAGGGASRRLRRALTCPTLPGRVVTREQLLDSQGRLQRDAKGKKVLGQEVLIVGDDGSSIIRAEPVLSRDMFDRVGVELSGRKNRKEPTARSSGLLLRILYCACVAAQCVDSRAGQGRTQAAIPLCICAIQGAVLTNARFRCSWPTKNSNAGFSRTLVHSNAAKGCGSPVMTTPQSWVRLTSYLLTSPTNLEQVPSNAAHLSVKDSTSASPR